MEHERRPSTRRVLAQYLESLQRAGLTYLPTQRGTRTSSPTPSPVDVHPADPAQQRGKSATVPPARARARTLFEETETVGPTGEDSREPAATAEYRRSTCSLSERQEQLADWERRVADCVRCRELAETRTQTVFGVGNPQARLLFVGEAPGADEDRQGEPFVGRAGQLLNKILAACRLKREDVYICNILKCRPPGNRNPAPQEADNCREYLDAQIAIVDPDYIVCLGGVAAQNLLEMKSSIGRLRQKFFAYQRARVMCTYHPSYLLRNPAAKKDVWDDMKMLMREMGVELS